MTDICSKIVMRPVIFLTSDNFWVLNNSKTGAGCKCANKFSVKTKALILPGNLVEGAINSCQRASLRSLPYSSIEFLIISFDGHASRRKFLLSGFRITGEHNVVGASKISAASRVVRRFVILFFWLSALHQTAQKSSSSSFVSLRCLRLNWTDFLQGGVRWRR